MEHIPFIPASKVKELLKPMTVIDVVEESMIEFSKLQGVQQPVRSVVSVKDDGYA